MKFAIIIFGLLAVLSNYNCLAKKKHSDKMTLGPAGNVVLFMDGKPSKRDSSDQTADKSTGGEQSNQQPQENYQYSPNYYGQPTNSQLKSAIEYTRSNEIASISSGPGGVSYSSSSNPSGPSSSYQTISYSTHHPGGNIVSIQQQQQQQPETKVSSSATLPIQHYPPGMPQHHNTHAKLIPQQSPQHYHHQQQQQQPQQHQPFIYAITLPTAHNHQQYPFVPLQQNPLANVHPQQFHQYNSPPNIQYQRPAVSHNPVSPQQFVIFTATPNKPQQAFIYTANQGQQPTPVSGNFLQHLFQPTSQFAPPRYAFAIHQQEVPLSSISQSNSGSVTPVPVIDHNYITSSHHQQQPNSGASYSTYSAELPLPPPPLPPSTSSDIKGPPPPSPLHHPLPHAMAQFATTHSPLMNLYNHRGPGKSLGKIYYPTPPTTNMHYEHQMFNADGGKEIISFTPPPKYQK